MGGTFAIVQARMGSTRLAGKVLLALGGRSVLANVIARIQSMPLIDGVVIATTQDPRDDPIVAEAVRCGASVFRGSEEDVLDRYYRAALEREAELVVRITSDCPLIDPGISNAIVASMLERRRAEHGFAYLSNTILRTFPRGFDTEVFPFWALERAWQEGVSPAEREHVTTYLYRHPELFPQAQFAADRDASHYRLTLDTPEDYLLLCTLWDELGIDTRSVSADEIIAFLDSHPEIAAINGQVQQKTLGA